jgi:hypothetical protein
VIAGGIDLGSVKAAMGPLEDHDDRALPARAICRRARRQDSRARAPARRQSRSPMPRMDGDGLCPRTRPPVETTMSVTIAGIEFESHHYDDRGDVLYLSVEGYDAGGLPPHADATPEGYGVEYDEGWRVIAMTLVNAIASKLAITIRLSRCDVDLGFGARLSDRACPTAPRLHPCRRTSSPTIHRNALASLRAEDRAIHAM